MTATAQNFEIYQGDDLTLRVTVKNPDNTPKDITGATIKWQMAYSVAATPPLLQKQIGSGITVVDAAAGIFDVTIAQADTNGLGGKDYYHEAELVDATSKKSTVLTGTVTVKPALIA